MINSNKELSPNFKTDDSNKPKNPCKEYIRKKISMDTAINICNNRKPNWSYNDSKLKQLSECYFAATAKGRKEHEITLPIKFTRKARLYSKKNYTNLKQQSKTYAV